MPRTLSLLFPNGETAVLAHRADVRGGRQDHARRPDVGHHKPRQLHRDGKALAVTLGADGESQEATED